MQSQLRLDPVFIAGGDTQFSSIIVLESGSFYKF